MNRIEDKLVRSLNKKDLNRDERKAPTSSGFQFQQKSLPMLFANGTISQQTFTPRLTSRLNSSKNGSSTQV